MIPILIVLFFTLMFTGMPIAIAIGGSAIITLVIQGNIPLMVAPQRVFVMLDSFPLMAVPLFILAGEVMLRGGVAQKLVNFSQALVGHIRGSHAHVTIVSSMFFSSVSGSAAASCSAIGSTMIPSMIKEKYDKDYIVAVLANASTLGPIIPPSVMMVIYGSMAGVSVGQMFLGGFIPGFMFVVGMMILSYIIALKRNYKIYKRSNVKEVFIAFKEAIWALIMPVIILGGIMLGVFTPTEAGAVAVLYGFVLGFANGNIKIRDLKPIFYRAALATTIPMLIIGIAAPFGWLLTINNFSGIMGSFIYGITEDPLVFMAIVVAFYLIIGFFIEANAALIIMVPVLAPMALSYGIDPVHFGVVSIIALVLGAVTPPVGILLFIASSLADVKVGETLKLVMAFVLLLAVLTFVFALVPQIILWLPTLVMR
ncbi:MAG: TRAP transporter large permease [Spirochaetes bacterium]|nr:TRAP transporter large permease [Spirochaetota bacterium]